MKIQSSTVQEDEIQHSIQTQHVKRRGNKKIDPKCTFNTQTKYSNTVYKLKIQTQRQHKNTILKSGNNKKNITKNKSKHENNTHKHCVQTQ